MNEMNNQDFNTQPTVPQAPVVQPEPATIVSEAPAVPMAKPKKKKSVLLIISIILNAVLILGIAAAAVFLYILPALNDDGEAEVVVKEYTGYEFFVCGLAPATDEDGMYGYINEKGEWAIKPRFTYANAFSTNGLAPVHDGEKWGYLDTKGEWVIEPKYDYAYPFYNGVAEVEKNVGEEYQYALISEKGDFLVKFGQYDYMDGFYENDREYSKVEKNGEYGIINTKGEEVVALGEYDYIGQVYKDGFIFAEDKKLGFADFKGNYLLEPEYDQLGYESTYEWCCEDGCYDYTYYGDYCEEHAPLEEYPYCSYSSCYNRVDEAGAEYCWEHNGESGESEESY